MKLALTDFEGYVKKHPKKIEDGYAHRSSGLSIKSESIRCFNLYKNTASNNTKDPIDLCVIGTGKIWDDKKIIAQYGKVTSQAKPKEIGGILADSASPYCAFSNLAYLLGGIEASKRFLIIGIKMHDLRTLLQKKQKSGLKSELAVLFQAGYTLTSIQEKDKKSLYATPPHEKKLEESIAQATSEYIGTFYTTFMESHDRDLTFYLKESQSLSEQ